MFGGCIVGEVLAGEGAHFFVGKHAGCCGDDCSGGCLLFAAALGLGEEGERAVVFCCETKCHSHAEMVST